MPDPAVRRRFEIVNEKGLHARASAKLAEVVERFEARAEVSHAGLSAAGDSIMGLLMLAASRGTVVEVRASGPDAEALLDAVGRLIADRFGEEA